MIILVGASASGKTEIANILIKKYGYEKMVTATTRPMRVNEVNKVDYFFLTEEEFKTKEKNKEFLETIEYNGYHYGSIKKEVKPKRVIILEPNGVNTFYKIIPNEVTIFYITASKDTRVKRMIERGDTEETIAKRLVLDEEHFSALKLDHIDYKIVNENKSLEVAALEVLRLYER